MAAVKWLLVTYKVPPEPPRRRIALWRKLKGLGAVYLQNGVCLLPKSTDHLRQIKIVEHEIADMGGEAVLLEVAPLNATQEARVVERFRADRDAEYKELMGRCRDFEAEIARETEARNFTYAELEENDVDLKKLKSWHAKIAALDFYRSPVGQEAGSRLEHCGASLEAFAQAVFNASEENAMAMGEAS